MTRSGQMKIGGQIEQKFSEFNGTEFILKQLLLEGSWWKKPPELCIKVSEYQIYNLNSLNKRLGKKRRKLCESTYHFFQNPEESYIQKCRLTVVDEFKDVCGFCFRTR